MITTLSRAKSIALDLKATRKEESSPGLVSARGARQGQRRTAVHQEDLRAQEELDNTGFEEALPCPRQECMGAAVHRWPSASAAPVSSTAPRCKPSRLFS